MSIRDQEQALLDQIYSMPPHEAIRYVERLRHTITRTERDVKDQVSRHEAARNYVQLCKDLNRAVNDYITNNGDADDIIKVLKDHGFMYADSVGHSYQINADRIYRAHRNHEI